MIKVNALEAKKRFSWLLRRVAAGEEITIADRGVPVARLVPVPVEGTMRKLGIFCGQMTIPEDFDAPLSKEIVESFGGKVPRTKAKRKTGRRSRSKSTGRQ
jgi:prevent-host-death family protein